MELEKLEVLLEINTQRVAESINRVMPQIDGLLKRIEQATGRSGKSVENNLDMSNTTKKVENTLNDFVSNFSKQMDRMESIAKEKSVATSRQMETGFKRTRTQAGKEIDLMVKDINAKLGQAKAAQGRIAELTARRSAAVKDNDTGQVVKYDSQIAQAENQMTSYRNKATAMARTMKAEFDAVPSSLSRISETMDLNESKIETMRAKIANMQKMYETQRKTVGSYQDGFGKTDSPESLGTMQKIQKETAQMNKLIHSNDALQQAYATTEDRAKVLRSALEQLNGTLNKSSIQTGNASLGMKNVANMSDEAKSVWSRFGGLFNRTTNNIAHGARRSGSLMAGFFSIFGRGSNKANKDTKSMGKSTGVLGRTISQLARRAIVYGLLYKGIMALSKGMLSALKTNDQFASSLNQIQVNLMTAFYPIYQAVLPAINALMSAIARVTGYIASFVATLFGTTYAAAKQGAQGLYENVKALEDTGSGADKAKDKVKELQRSLMGFDEINRIGLDVNSDDSLDSGGSGGGIDFGTPDYATPAWLDNLAKNARDILSRLFDPVKAAWDKNGKTVTDAFKYSLNEIWGLTKSIGASFMEVWTNGTGELFIGNILLLLSNVLYIIGDIAKAFKDAWNDEGRGTALIQSIFNMWNSVLELLHKITSTFRNVWNDGTGERIAGNLLGIYTNVNETVSELAKRFGEAWDEAGNGERIFQSILGFAEDVTEKVNEITEATKDWAKNLDFGPLLSSISGMMTNLRSALQPLLDGLGALYEKVLLPIAKWAVEEGLPAAFDAISEAFRFLGNVLEAIKPVLTWLWEELLVPLGNWYGGRVVKTFENIAGGLGFLADAVENPKKAFGELRDTVVNKASDMWSNTKTYFGNIKNNITDNMLEAAGLTREEVEGMELSSAGSFKGIWDNVKKFFPNINKDVSDNASKASKSGSASFKDMKDNIGKRASESWSSVKGSFADIQKWVSDKSGSAQKNASTSFSNLRTNVGTYFGNIRTNANDVWNTVSSKVGTKANEARINAVSAFSIMKTKTGGYMTEIKNSTKQAFDQVAGWASGLGSRIASGISGGLNAVKRAAASIGNGIVGTIGKALNGVINGINWVLGKVGAGGSKIATWSVPQYARGTNSHPGGIAMVNDAPGQHYQEAYEVNGKVGLFPKVRNMFVDLPRGAKVLDGKRTAKMYGGSIPQYAGGIGNWLGKAWNGAKEMAGTVWDYVSNPSKLLDIAISKFVNLSGAFEPALSIAKGGIGTIAKEATNYVKGFLNQGPADSGYGKVNFNGLVRTSGFGYRTHPITGKRHLHAGVDYGGGMGIGHPIHAQTSGTVKSAGPAGGGYGNWVNIKNGVYDYIYAHLSKALVGRGAAVETGQKIGLMGNTGNSTGPHVHYEVRKNGSPIDPDAYHATMAKNSGSPAGQGVERWRSTIVRALSMNGLPTSEAYVSAWLRQIRTESGGNEKAVQSPSVVDVNTLAGNPARGLLQTIPQTFNAYKFAGYGNIYNGLHNALAAINYAKNRYGRTGMLSVIGNGHGYENGGLVTRDSYRVGEGNKKELIIPLEKRNRALELLDLAKSYLGVDDYSTTLQMPDVMLSKPIGRFESTHSNHDISGGGLSGMSSSIELLLRGLIGNNKQSGGNLEVTLEIDRSKLGKAVIKEINEVIDKTGKVPLDI